jgi:hypothetical protein
MKRAVFDRDVGCLIQEIDGTLLSDGGNARRRRDHFERTQKMVCSCHRLGRVREIRIGQ